VVLFALASAGCDELDLGGKPPPSTELPSRRQLEKIAYMSQAPGPDARPIFDHLEQARSCRDFELAMRWNRPPDVKGGSFNEKIAHLSSGFAANLLKESEVFLSGVIERGESLPSGSSGWTLKLRDGSEVQAIERVEYRQQQEQRQQEGGGAALVMPCTRGRTLCAYGIYQGITGMSRNQRQRVPLVSVLFAMDRRR